MGRDWRDTRNTEGGSCCFPGGECKGEEAGEGEYMRNGRRKELREGSGKENGGKRNQSSTSQQLI